jgi:hypothetical protein
MSEAPHLPQKFDAGGISAPHSLQSLVSAFPQRAQKLLTSGLLVPHFEQRIVFSKEPNEALCTT